LSRLGQWPLLEMSRMRENDSVLTERELEIVRAVATGATNQQIAHELVISVNTVKVHLKNIFAKLDIQSRTEVALYAVSQGWIELERPIPGAEEAVEAVSEGERPRRQSISLGKRVYLLAAAVLAALLVFFPEVRRQPASTASSEFADVGTSTELGGPALEFERWNAMAAMPTARSRLAAAYSEGKIYAIGGDTGDGATGIVEEYDTSVNGWRVKNPKPIPVHNVGAAAIGGKVFVPGGYTLDGEAIADLEIYDPSEDSWGRGAPLPTPLCAYAIASVGDKLYVFGGWNGSVYVASTYEYDTLSDSWLERSPMPTARGFAGAATLEGNVYVAGGYDGRDEFATVEEYDPTLEGAGEPWRTRSPMMMRRGGVGVAAIAGSLYAIGGGWNGYLAYNERYDPRRDEWSTIETPVFGEWRNLGVVNTETKIYAIGGWNGDFLNLSQEYRALFTYYLPEVP
jgi:DNA-binding CsgD family transcriptional regulator/N-acetylneuraminic acid mutarotase